jgi:hypothetical protein
MLGPVFNSVNNGSVKEKSDFYRLGIWWQVGENKIKTF